MEVILARAAPCQVLRFVTWSHPHFNNWSNINNELKLRLEVDMVEESCYPSTEGLGFLSVIKIVLGSELRTS